MSSRFLYTGPDGKTVELPSTKALRAAIEAGDIDGDTLLFDSLTDVWASARTLPIFQLALEAIESSEADPPGLGALAVDEAQLDSTVDEFVRRARKEREEAAALDPACDRNLDVVRDDTRPDIAMADVETVTEDSPFMNMEDAPDTSAVGRTDPQPRPVAAAGPASETPVVTSRSVTSRSLTPRSVTPVSSDGLRRVAFIAALVAVGGWAIADAWATSAAGLPTETVFIGSARDGVRPDSPAGAMMIRESSDAAFRDMTIGMERIRSRLGVDAPPTSWLSGRYLSDPASAPEVLDYWTKYEAFVDSLRTSEEDLFRSGFVTRLQESGITGPVLSIRLAAGLSDFRADRGRRESVYRAMEDLAAEARYLDDFLRANTDRIAYAGVREGAVSNAPGIEAIPLDEETRLGMKAQFDRLFEAMDRVTGMDPTRIRDLTGTAFEQLAYRR